MADVPLSDVRIVLEMVAKSFPRELDVAKTSKGQYRKAVREAIKAPYSDFTDAMDDLRHVRGGAAKAWGRLVTASRALKRIESQHRRTAPANAAKALRVPVTALLE